MIMPPADSHTATFRPFFNPATGEWITYTAIAADNNGQLVRFNWRSVPGGVITEHIHPPARRSGSPSSRAKPTSPLTASRA
jgi:hypothetical protein